MCWKLLDLLLTDTDDMVQKGYGWLLKEASRKHQEEVFDYVMRNKKLMPRTALRYAIELMPKDLKAEAMKKDWQVSGKYRSFKVEIIPNIIPKKNLLGSAKFFRPYLPGSREFF